MTPEENQLEALKLIRGIASQAEPPKPAFDPRDKLWEISRANEGPGMDRRGLMRVLSWLYYKRNVHDFALLDGVSRVVSRARNAYALFQPGGKMLDALVGRVAEERALRNKAIYEAEDRAFFAKGTP